ncbi:AAA family ATPase [Acidianus brierleyi]|uniref:CobQ/CobB/MinD/ParA nucleotide binding domain-containing protein n=1 Tax=Acidianus brierleyi TaxID=41673 RepID=A0A2U9IBC0_9CREN|nr:AAA family ATPase [Acidianus brierleyi]
MQIIKVSSIKGGVGKSTISAYLSKYLSKRHKVLLIDADLIKYSGYIVKVFEGFWRLKRNLTVYEIEENDNIEKILKNNYEYAVVDCPPFPEIICNKIDSNIDIYVSDITSLDLLLQYVTNKKIKILVINMVPPFPEDLEQISEKIKNLDFNLKVVIPFIPKIFMSKFRDIENSEIEIIEKMSNRIEKNSFNGEVISPLS